MIILYESHDYIPIKLKLINILLEISDKIKFSISIFLYLLNILNNKNLINFIKKKENY